MNQQIDLMITMCAENPTEAIGKSKELIENCCKEIIENFGDDIKESISVAQLVKQSLKLLNIRNENAETDL